MKHSSIVHDGSHTAIKLRRGLVQACAIGKPSQSFSHQLELLGRQLHIYCTDDNGTITNVLHGTVKRASKKGPRRWLFVPDRIEDVKQFNTGKLVRV
jgi:hypothetical protein